MQKNLIIGKNSNFGKILEQHLPGSYLGRDQFDLLNPNWSQFDNLSVDNVIFLTKGNPRNFVDVGKICDSVFSLLDRVQHQTAWIFTSGMGTYHGSRNTEHLLYSAEKMLINFIAYKKNHGHNHIRIIHPGHMDRPEIYLERVQDFLELLEDPPSKNLIWSLSDRKYIPF